MTGVDELFEYIERQAQITALQKAMYVLFPYKEYEEEIPKKELEIRLLDLIKKVEAGELL